MPMIEYSQFDRFFLAQRTGKYRVSPLSFDPRHGMYLVELVGGSRDGERVRCERQDLKIHWDAPKDHADWNATGFIPSSNSVVAVK